MSLTLTVDGDRWRTHLRAVADAHPGLVPVIKGNGYGFGNHRLARRAAWLGVDTVAVGTYEELPEVASRFDGDLLVLTPWRPFGTALELAPALARRVVHTVGRTEDLAGLLDRDPDARFVLERLTSMRRHGFTATGLREAADLLRSRGFSDGDQRLRGVALHLPLARGEHLPEVHRLLDDVVAAGLGTPTAWVSHLTDAELASLATSHADFGFRPRIGTALWLGDRGALRVGRDGPRRPPARAWRRLRLPRPARRPGRAPARRQRRHRPRDRARVAHR